MMRNNPFTIFNTPITFGINTHDIEKTYIMLQKNIKSESDGIAISQAYTKIINPLKRGEEILKIFNISYDNVPIDAIYIDKIFTLKMEKNTEELLVIQDELHNSLAQLYTITTDNILDFAIKFIKYKYTIHA